MVGKCVNRYHTVDSNGYLKVKILNVLSLEDDADVGYILEVDLLYPEHIDDLHRDLTIVLNIDYLQIQNCPNL